MTRRASPDRATRLAPLRSARYAPFRGTTAVADRLHSAAVHLLRQLRQRDAELQAPVGPAGLSALSVLVFGGPQTVGQLARAEGVKRPTMSRLVATLERDGMVARDSDPNDGRAVRVRATDIGRGVMHRGREARVLALARLLDTLPPAEVAQLGRAAESIESLLQRET
jgi:DNA-binding MarR family transcriptional regulator